jgi:hypothetical protein
MRVYPEGYNVISDLRGRVALAHRLRAAGDLAPTNDSTGAFLEQLLTHIDTLTAERDAARAERDRLAACVERVREVAAANYRNMERLGVEAERLRESVRELETFIDNLVREANA